MSKQDGIIEVFEGNQTIERPGYGKIICGVLRKDYRITATEIEALFAKSNAESFAKGQVSVRRRNKSGCCCIISDNEDITSVCGAHQNWHDELNEEDK